MDIPGLILRFRNASKGEFLAIDEHKKILTLHGKVLWGWWRRNEEDDRRSLWAGVCGPTRATLISASEELQYAVLIERVIVGSPSDLELVPAYYRDAIPEIQIWFELSKIDLIAFSPELAAKVRNRTRTVFTSEDILVDKVTHSSPLLFDSKTGVFVALSDVHLFEGEHNFLLPGQTPSAHKSGAVEKILTLAKAIRADLDRCDITAIDGVIVSGDIVSRGTWAQKLVEEFFRELCDCLSISMQNVFCVPGNHDFYRQDTDIDDASALVTYQHEHSYRIFRNKLFDVPIDESLNYSVSCLHKDFELRIGFLNSARWTATPNFSEYGFVGRDAYTDVLDQMNVESNLPIWKVLVLHHHLLPIRAVERPGPKAAKPVSVSLDAVDLLDDAQKARVDLVVHGHQHIPDFLHLLYLLFHYNPKR